MPRRRRLERRHLLDPGPSADALGRPRAARTDLDWLQTSQLVTTLGVDGRLREIKEKVDFRDFDTGRPLQSSQAFVDRSDTLIGAYLQQTILPTRWLSFNLGARLDKETRFDGVVSPRFAAAVRAWHGGTLKGSYAEAFRSPAYAETDYTSTVQLPTAGTLSPSVSARSRPPSAEARRAAAALRCLPVVVEGHRRESHPQAVRSSRRPSPAAS